MSTCVSIPGSWTKDDETELGMTTWAVFLCKLLIPWYLWNNKWLKCFMSESHLIAHHQFSSHFTKTSRHTWAHSTTQQLWNSAAEDNRELHNYSRSHSFSYHRLITGQCLTKTPRGSSIAGCKIACPISVLTFSSGGKKFKAEKTGMMLRDAVSCICVPQDKNTRDIKTWDCVELQCMRSKQTKDNTMTNGVDVK